MNNNTILYSSLVTAVLLFALTVAPLPAFTQQLKGVNRKVSDRDRRELQREEERDYYMTAAVGGGYFAPFFAGMEDMLYPNIGPNTEKTKYIYTPSFKAFWHYERPRDNTPGMGLEAGYAFLRDKEAEDSGIHYGYALPYLLFNLSPFDDINMFIKSGVGAAYLRSDIEDLSGRKFSKSTVDFTVMLGGVIDYAILKRYVVGIEAFGYYYFEIDSSASYGANFFVGLRF